MQSFNKFKAVLLAACALISVAFLMASASMFIQDQPINTIFISLIASLLIAGLSVGLFLDLKNELNTVKALVVFKDGELHAVSSQDIDEVYLADLMQRIKKGKLNNRELVSHIVFHFERQKSLGVVSSTAALDIRFRDLYALSKANQYRLKNMPSYVQLKEKEALEQSTTP